MENIALSGYEQIKQLCASLKRYAQLKQAMKMQARWTILVLQNNR